MKTKRVPILMFTLMLAVLLFSGLMFTAIRPAVVSASSTLPVTVNSAAIATTTTFNSQQWSYTGSPYTTADIFWAVDVGTVNTMTLALQVSPDGTNWFADSTLASGIVADTNAYTSSVNIVGRYFRVVATVVNTNTITPTVIAVYH